jgi:hypothetical protein
MNDYQVYLLARQRIDQLQRIDHLHAEALALDHGPGVPRRLAGSLRALADWMRIPGSLRCSIAAATVFTAFAVVGWAPAWAQAPAPASPEKTWAMKGADSEVSPRLQGYLLDNGDFTIYDPFQCNRGKGQRGVDARQPSPSSALRGATGGQGPVRSRA